MERTYPVNALQKDAAAVRCSAREDLARLTADGHGMHESAAEEAFEHHAQGDADNLFDQRIAEAIRRGDEAIARGEAYTPEKAWKMIRASRAKQS
ncbi:MAG: hypothetical protein ACI361_04175 [Atopobiaceae bacterium]